MVMLFITGISAGWAPGQFSSRQQFKYYHNHHYKAGETQEVEMGTYWQLFKVG